MGGGRVLEGDCLGASETKQGWFGGAEADLDLTALLKY